jgi:hypothetical protein
MRFLLGSSYFDRGKGGAEFRRELATIWSENNSRADVAPTRTVIISEAGSKRPAVGWATDVVRLTGDLGHCHDLIEGRKPHEFAGWSATMCALAMTAYADEADFLYKEEDCLAFGPWVKRIYDDLGSGDIVFGGKMKSAPWMPCAQSLFLVRHRAIPLFVRTYLGLGGDNNKNTLGEAKFARLASMFPMKVRYLSFGVDRERPIPWDDPVFYFQQPTAAELEEASRRGLITCNSCLRA